MNSHGNGLKYKVVIGIDPGLKGGVAFTFNGITHARPIPTKIRSKGKEDIDIVDLSRTLDGMIDSTPEIPEILIILEEPIAMPRQNSVSTLTAGRNYGKLVALCELRNWPYQEIKPTVWKKVILEGTKKEKEDAIAYVQKRFPSISLQVGKKKKLHDGMADAICICEYGRRLMDGRHENLS